jgi:hypothetical protein
LNGHEIENLLTAIDESILRGKHSRRVEVLAYLRDHEAEALSELRATNMVSVPTSAGPVVINLSELEALVA